MRGLPAEGNFRRLEPPSPGVPHPTPANAGATFSRKREKASAASFCLTTTVLLAIVIFAAAPVGPAQAGDCRTCTAPHEAFSPARPNFDCALARTLSEQTICADETLARLDDRLNLVFQKKRETLPPGTHIKFLTEELAWVRRRDLTCNMRGESARRRCLEEMMISRIGELDRMTVLAK